MTNTDTTPNTNTTTTSTTTLSDTGLSQERIDLLEALAAHRGFLHQTAQGLTEEQARACPTASALSIGGIIKHVASCERGWAEFMLDGSGLDFGADVDWSSPDPAMIEAYHSGFRLTDGETLAGVLAEYERVADETDRLVRDLPSLDSAYPLPPAPWFAANATRSVRRAVVHIIAETAQHAGHADIIRETIDGAKTMG